MIQMRMTAGTSRSGESQYVHGLVSYARAIPASVPIRAATRPILSSASGCFRPNVRQDMAAIQGGSAWASATSSNRGVASGTNRSCIGSDRVQFSHASRDPEYISTATSRSLS